MDNVTEIRDVDDRLLAYKVGGNTPEGLHAYSPVEDFVQVLSWHYPRGKALQAHVHLHATREATRTQEAVVVIVGSVRADIYDEGRRLIAQQVVKCGECMVFLDGGHGFEILEDGTRIFEIKNGPFPGVEVDKEKF